MDVSKVYYVQAFEGETCISTVSYPESFTIEIPRFSPLPDENIVFYFEACHAADSNSGVDFNVFTGSYSYPRSDFFLKLVRQHSSKVYPSLVMSMDVNIYYSDGSVFKMYEPLSNIRVDHVSSFDFEIATNELYLQPSRMIKTKGLEEPERINDNRTFSVHSNKMRRGALTLKCKMSFNDDIKRTPLWKNVKSSSNFSNNLKSVYESNVFKDFVFIVGDKSFPVHKVILVAHSPVFTKMLAQDCLESKTNTVTITDASPDIFDLFLKYLYSSEIEDKSWPSVKELYSLADKYDVGILKNDCIDIVISHLSVDFVCEILKLAYTYDDSRLKSAAKIFSVDHIRELISREDWKDLVVLYPIIGYEVIVNFVPT